MVVHAGRPGPRAHVEALQEFVDAGFDELYVQQIGPDQDAFFDEWAQDILPRFHDDSRRA